MADDDDDRRDSDAPPVPAKGVLEQRAFDALEKDIQEVSLPVSYSQSIELLITRSVRGKRCLPDLRQYLIQISIELHWLRLLISKTSSIRYFGFSALSFGFLSCVFPSLLSTLFCM